MFLILKNEQTISRCKRNQRHNLQHPSDQQPTQPKEIWWSQTGSNRRPEACKATALPTELWPHNKVTNFV